MIEVATVDAISTIRLLESIASLYLKLALIHVYLDNATETSRKAGGGMSSDDPGAGSSCI